MRFSRCQFPTYEQSLERDRVPSARRLANSERAVQRQRASWGLFADQVDIPNAEERLASIALANAQFYQKMRDHDARNWRRGRAALFAQPEPRRSELLHEWQHSRLPGRSAYFCDWLYGLNLLPRTDTGELREEYEARQRAEGNIFFTEGYSIMWHRKAKARHAHNS